MGPVRGSLTSFRSSKSQVVEPRSFRIFLFSPGLRRNDTIHKILYVDHLLQAANRPLEQPDFRPLENHRHIVAAAAPRLFRDSFLSPGLESATILTEEVSVASSTGRSFSDKRASFTSLAPFTTAR